MRGRLPESAVHCACRLGDVEAGLLLLEAGLLLEARGLLGRE